MAIQVFQEMIGQVMESVSGGVGGDRMVFEAANGRKFEFFHEQDCCEDVHIEDIIGDVNDLIGVPILEAEQVSWKVLMPMLANGRFIVFQR